MYQTDVLTCPCCRQTGKPDASQGLQGMRCSAGGYYEHEHTPRLVRSLAGSITTFAAAGLANSGENLMSVRACR